MKHFHCTLKNNFKTRCGHKTKKLATYRPPVFCLPRKTLGCRFTTALLLTPNLSIKVLKTPLAKQTQGPISLAENLEAHLLAGWFVQSWLSSGKLNSGTIPDDCG
jgi:hypothetical protein